MYINDDFVINFFFTNKGRYKIIWNDIEERLPKLKYYKDLLKYLKNRFTDSLSLKETIYRIFYKIEVRPVCIECGNHVQFTGIKKKNFFDNFCCKTCRYKHTVKEVKNHFLENYGVENPSQLQSIKDKKVETTRKHYGVDNPSQVEEIKKKKEEKSLEVYGTKYVFQAEEVKEKITKSFLKTYGVKSYTQTEEYKKKTKETNNRKYGKNYYTQTDEYKERVKATYLEKYGAENVFASEKIKERMKETWIKKYGVDNPAKSDQVYQKVILTNLSRYGVKVTFQSEIIKEKCKETCLRRYGKPFYAQTNEYKEKVIETNLIKYGVPHQWANRQIIEKGWETKRKNKTFSTSSIEEEIYNQLLQIFPIDAVIRQYKEERYPWRCDFYIKPLDLFIEVQGTWTHGKHPFDKNNSEDLKILEEWIQKSKMSEKNMFITAINGWTNRDVKKRKIAIENNINFIEIFSTSPYLRNIFKVLDCWTNRSSNYLVLI